MLDNLKAGIVRACAKDPEPQRSYRECAEHYKFVISPCLPRTPRHKGKVERGVLYVKSSFLAGRTFTSLNEANEAARKWVLEVAGARVHGTTRTVPLEVFVSREKPALRPLPETPFDEVTYRRQTLPPDCHVIIDQAFYSAPHTLIGKNVVVAATSSTVRVYHEHVLVATHVRTQERGKRVCSLLHFPPEKVRYITQDRPWCRARAKQIGPHAQSFVEPMLSGRIDRLRGAQSLLRLADKHGPERLEAACARAAVCGATDVRTVATVLSRNLDKPEPDLVTLSTRRPVFARSFHNLFNPAAVAGHPGETPWTTCIN